MFKSILFQVIHCTLGFFEHVKIVELNVTSAQFVWQLVTLNQGSLSLMHLKGIYFEIPGFFSFKNAANFGFILLVWI